jgi:hypothetical protein
MNPSSTQPRIASRVFRAILIVWALLSLLAMAGLYYSKLLKEDIRWYGGESVEAQRHKVLERAGTPYANLDEALSVLHTWPKAQGYSARGDFNQLSYFKYIAIPHLPDGSSGHDVHWDAHGLTATPIEALGINDRAIGWHIHAPHPAGFTLSLICIMALALAFKRLCRKGDLSMPEACAGVLLLIGVAIPTSRFAFGTIVPATLTLTALAVILYVFSRRCPRLDAQHNAAPPRNHTYAFFAVLLLACGWSLAKAAIVVPDDWDAWAIWGAKAKVLALGQGALLDVRYFGHADYPLLWPSLWSFAAWFCGGWEEHWCRAWGAILLALTAWQLRDSAWHLTRNTVASWIAPLILLSTPKVLLFASWGYAEAPLWLMLACAANRMLRWQQNPTRTHAMLCGLFCAAAALTKNEGLLFSLLILLVMLSRKGTRQTLIAWVVPWTLAVGPWIAWKCTYLPTMPRVLENVDASSSQIQYMLHRLPDAVTQIARNWATVSSWNLALPIAIFCTLYAVATRASHMRRFAAIPLLALAALFVVVLNSPDPVYWQIDTAWDRLTAQTLPFMAILCATVYASIIRAHQHE